MSQVQMLRSEEENDRQQKRRDADVQLHKADVQQLVVKEEEVLPEQLERSSSWNQEEPLEPAHIKEEQEELWINQEREHLQGAEESDIIAFTFNPASVKSEEEDGEKPQSSQLHEIQSEENRDPGYLKTESVGEDCGGSEADRDFNPDYHLQAVTLDKTSHLSGSDTDDSADWEESYEPQEGLTQVQSKDRAVSDEKCETGDTSVSSSDCASSFGHKKCQKKHKGDKPFRCSVCGKRYPLEKNLRQHMRRHSVEKPFTCSVCSKSFLWRAEMVAHMRVHTGEKPFSCSVCGKTFKQVGSLKKHSVVHTGEKPFSCSVCGESFSNRINLIKHSFGHTGEEPFKGFLQILEKS
ncbi:zinc finger protein 135-like [Cheilinus undulatus]|uniref:zinc finger protein 135-like n=1 Tax=Cheilinus undulatus TaxID=241271 RepID=UPI001BD3EC93|nr:zinc finger protein 135-like [Cheilinus undulatus]